IDCFFPGFYAEGPCHIIPAAHRDDPDDDVKADGLPDQPLQSAVSSHRDKSPGAARYCGLDGGPELSKRPAFSKLHSEISPRELRSHLGDPAGRFAAAGTRIRKNHSAHRVFHGFECFQVAASLSHAWSGNKTTGSLISPWRSPGNPPIPALWRPRDSWRIAPRRSCFARFPPWRW